VIQKIVVLLTSILLDVSLVRNVEYSRWREFFLHCCLPNKESRFQFSIRMHQFCNHYRDINYYMFNHSVATRKKRKETILKQTENILKRDFTSIVRSVLLLNQYSVYITGLTQNTNSINSFQKVHFNVCI